MTRPCEHPPFPTPSSQMPVVWVGVLGIIRTPRRRGRWSIDEAKHHINYLELLAAFDALQCFASHSLRICLLTDNSPVVGYINKMGGMASPSLNHLTRKLWVWCLEREIFVVAQHIPGKDNV